MSSPLFVNRVRITLEYVDDAGVVDESWSNVQVTGRFPMIESLIAVIVAEFENLYIKTQEKVADDSNSDRTIRNSTTRDS